MTRCANRRVPRRCGGGAPCPTWRWCSGERRGRGARHRVVQPYLSIVGPPKGIDPRVRVCCTNTTGLSRERPFSRAGQWRVWERHVEDATGATHTLSIDRFPSDAYELPQISLDARMVNAFSSLAGLPVHDAIGGRILQGVTTGNSIEALQHVRDWTLIREPRGWVRLPTVAAGPTVDFIGGLVNFMRGNWERAQSGFASVARNAAASSRLRVDAALLLAATQSRLDPKCAACAETVAIATSISPYSPVVARYELMAELVGAPSPAAAAAVLQRVVAHPARFPADDPFTRSAKAVLAQLTVPPN